MREFQGGNCLGSLLSSDTLDEQDLGKRNLQASLGRDYILRLLESEKVPSPAQDLHLHSLPLIVAALPICSLLVTDDVVCWHAVSAQVTR